MCAPPGVANRRVITATIVIRQQSRAGAEQRRAGAGGWIRQIFSGLAGQPGTIGNLYAEFLAAREPLQPISTDFVQLHRSAAFAEELFQPLSPRTTAAARGRCRDLLM